MVVEFRINGRIEGYHLDFAFAQVISSQINYLSNGNMDIQVEIDIPFSTPVSIPLRLSFDGSVGLNQNWCIVANPTILPRQITSSVTYHLNQEGENDVCVRFHSHENRSFWIDLVIFL